MHDWMSQQIGTLVLAGAVLFAIVRKFMDHNPGVKDVAKKAVADKAIGIIVRLLK